MKYLQDNKDASEILHSSGLTVPLYKNNQLYEKLFWRLNGRLDKPFYNEAISNVYSIVYYRTFWRLHNNLYTQIKYHQ